MIHSSRSLERQQATRDPDEPVEQSPGAPEAAAATPQPVLTGERVVTQPEANADAHQARSHVPQRQSRLSRSSSVPASESSLQSPRTPPPRPRPQQPKASPRPQQPKASPGGKTRQESGNQSDMNSRSGGLTPPPPVDEFPDSLPVSEDSDEPEAPQEPLHPPLRRFSQFVTPATKEEIFGIPTTTAFPEQPYERIRSTGIIVWTRRSTQAFMRI